MQSLPGISLQYDPIFFSACHAAGYRTGHTYCKFFIEALKNCGQASPSRDIAEYASCWTFDLHPQFCSTAAGSVWSTLTKAVWSSNESMPPVAFPWPSNSRYFCAKSYSYEYHPQKWTRILVCSSGYPTTCVKVIFVLAKRAGICYVCTWTVLMRNERLNVKQEENCMAIRFWKTRK